MFWFLEVISRLFIDFYVSYFFIAQLWYVTMYILDLVVFLSVKTDNANETSDVCCFHFGGLLESHVLNHDVFLDDSI